MALSDSQVHGLSDLFGVDPESLQRGNFERLRHTSNDVSESRSNSGFFLFWPTASRIDVIAPAQDAYAQFPQPGRKKAISSFSNKSRLNLMKRLSTIHRKAEFRAITLTYKDNVNDKGQYKKDLHAFLQRLRIDHPRIGAIWKLEFQKRGAAHFHLIVFGGWIDYRWIASTWDRIAGNEFGNSHSTSTRIEYPENATNATRYMLSYLEKRPDAEHLAREFTGRIWGIHNRSTIPFANNTGYATEPDLVRAILDYYADRFGVPYRLTKVTIFLTDSHSQGLSYFLANRANGPPN